MLCCASSPDHNGSLQRTSSTSDEYIGYITDPKNIEKKFPVDRKKLEKLILGMCVRNVCCLICVCMCGVCACVVCVHV